MTEHTGIVKKDGRYHGYTSLTVPIGRTPEEQHEHEPAHYDLAAGQVYTLDCEGHALKLEIVRLVHHLVEFTVWQLHDGKRIALGSAAMPRRWVYQTLDHRAARMFTIERTHHGWRYTAIKDGNTNGSPFSDKETIEWIVACYGFLMEYGETLTGPQFAERIERHYSLEEPRNRAAYNFVRTA